MSLIEKPSGKQLSKKIDRLSSYLTIVPYLEQISHFKEITFPRIKTLVFLQTESISLNFLKLWKKQQWKVEKIVFEGVFPDLSNAEQLG